MGNTVGRPADSPPFASFHFLVDFGNLSNSIAFTEVTGLDRESGSIDYRHGDNKLFSTTKMPGTSKNRNVTMKRGIMTNDDNLRDWLNQAGMDTVRRVDVTIKLLDETGNVAMAWKLANAWPVKIQGADLHSSGREVAIESIEIAHEGLTASQPGQA